MDTKVDRQRDRQRDRQKDVMMIDNLDPKFLYTWKGTRHEDEMEYHSHDYVEVAYVLSGVGKYRIEDKIYDVAEGDFIVFNPGVRHQAIFVKEAEVPTTEFFVGFGQVQLPNCPENNFPVPNGGHIIHTTGELRQRLFRICSSMEAEKAARRPGRYYMMKSYLIQMIILVLREQAEPEPDISGIAFESVNKKYLVDKMVSYLEDHYNEKISLDQIAENMYLSPFYISKIFKSETGDTPIRHLINIRLEKAKELLERGYDGSVQEIAAMVGYDDAYHFSKLFKKRFQITPTQAKRGKSV